jgi:TonB family protein
MNHGIQEFFLERARCRRRVSTISVFLGLLLLMTLGAPRLPVIGPILQKIPILRFGFEGPNRYVRLVQIEADPGAPLIDIGRVQPVSSRRGGTGNPTPSKSVSNVRRKRNRLRGPGDESHDLIARALSNQARVPIFQSDELIIDRLVRPTYPEDARDRGIEGKVAVLARVDTAGQVIEVEVMGGSGEAQLDHAAEQAVRQCRFRPYRVNGAAREVYAVFRFAFRIY